MPHTQTTTTTATSNFVSLSLQESSDTTNKDEEGDAVGPPRLER